MHSRRAPKGASHEQGPAMGGLKRAGSLQMLKLEESSLGPAAFDPLRRHRDRAAVHPFQAVVIGRTVVVRAFPLLIVAGHTFG